MPTQANAQPRDTGRPEDFGIRSRKALKLYQEGLLCLSYRSHACAYEKFKAATEAEPEFALALMRAGVAAYELGKQDESIVLMERGVAVNAGAWPSVYYYLGAAMIQKQDYQKAADYYERFLAAPNQLAHMVESAKKQLGVARFAADAIKNPVRFTPINLGPNVNGPHEEYMPLLTADGRLMFFTSRRPESTGGYNHESHRFEEDIFYSQRSMDTGWAPAQNLGPPINTEMSEGAATLTPDGQSVIFTACSNPNGIGGCDLYVAEFDGVRWSAPRNMGRGVNTAFWESYPSISSDGNTLYFASNRPGSLGGGGSRDSDIWVSHRENGQWQPAYNLGPPVNTTGRESGPFLHADDQTLYFCSNGHAGFGGLDIFIAHRTTDTTWGQPQNLGHPLNTAQDEQTIFVTTDGQTGYLNSDRPGGLGGIDIYRFELDARIRPRRATFVRGVVLDSLSREVVGAATVSFIDLQTGDTVRAVRTAAANGRFLLTLPLQRDYAAFVEAENYLWSSQNFSLRDVQGQPFFDLTIELSKLRQNQVVHLANLFFDFDKASLMPESFIELRKLLTFLAQNPRAAIEIRGHTDDKGSDDYNLRLSQGRADAVRAWLESQGVAANRLESIGFGETLPRVPNTTDEGRAQNRRTEFRVLRLQ